MPGEVVDEYPTHMRLKVVSDQMIAGGTDQKKNWKYGNEFMAADHQL